MEVCMTNQTQVRKIKCPRCGWENPLDAAADGEAITSVTLGPGGGVRRALQDMIARTASHRADHDLDEANAWMDLLCANCKKTFFYNTRTEEVKP
jgi:predicted nucleic-acid-binding Zn-ribbon protein